ncbi:hypothetical protein [Oceanobacillus sp. CF4.6]|uniref:hypothetical protein n=1 Tax=Oceanobacillus sp. CF4.6 TaxID=3373080 RepID=UPI003EE6229A
MFFFQFNKTNGDIKTIDEISILVNDMMQLTSTIQQKDVQIADYLLTQKTKYIDSFNAYTEELQSLSNNLESTLNTDEQKEILNSILANDENINDTFFNKMVPAVDEGLITYAASLRNYSSDLRNENTELVNQLVDITEMKQTKANLKDVATSSNSMNHLIEEIASVSEESAAGVEQAAASAQQTASSMEEVSHSAEELSALAERLNEQLKIFKL